MSTAPESNNRRWASTMLTAILGRVVDVSDGLRHKMDSKACHILNTRVELLCAALACLLVATWAPQIHAYSPDGANIDWFEEFKIQLPEPPHPLDAGTKGQITYSYSIELPVARVAPSLSLSYSSQASVSREMPFGWTVGGILEIQRPSMPRIYDDSQDMFVMGDEIQGVLRSSGGSYRMYTTAPNVDVEAVYDASTDSWLVESTGGSRWSLVGVDDGASSSSGTALWRVDQKWDTLGNSIDYDYDADGRIHQIEYGGNSDTADAHLVLVEFFYTADTIERTSARGGFVDTLVPSVESIRVSVADGSGWSLIRQYVLSVSCSVDESVMLLDEIQERGYDGPNIFDEPPVVFGYSEYSEAGVQAPASAYTPSDLGRTVLVTNVSNETIHSYQESALVDFNGDGLPDYLESDGSGNWSVTYQMVDHVTREYYWSATATSFTGPMRHLNYTDHSGGDYGRLLTMLTDLDGDGYPDLIATDEDTFGVPTKSWEVWYGTGSGFEPTSTEEQSFKNTIELNYEAAAAYMPKTLHRLQDINGDGWLDLVHLHHNDYAMIWYHTGNRGGGFLSGVSVEAPWCVDLHPDDMYCGMANMETISGSSGVVEDSLVLSGFQDMNGDGRADFVLANPLSSYVGAPLNHVAVYFGNGEGWEDAVFWSDPVNLVLSWRNQGSPSDSKHTWQTLMDVDADGLPDIVYDDRWYKNLGIGFSHNYQATPSWWAAGGAGLSRTNVVVYGSDITHTDVFRVVDANNDRVPDMLSTMFGLTTHGYYPGPNLLISIEEGGGVVADVTYRAASNAYPSGDPTVVQQMARPADLADEIDSEDLVTGRTATTLYDFSTGVHFDGVFQGFEQREVTTKGSVNQWLKYEEIYELAQDYPPLLQQRLTYSDADMGFSPSMATGGGPTPIARVQEDFEYDQFGTHYLLSEMEVQQWGDAGRHGDGRGYSVSYEFDSYGFLSTVYHASDGAGVEDDTLIELEWVASSSEQLRRLEGQHVSGWDAINTLWRQMEWLEFYYDNNLGGVVSDGVLTDKIVHSWWYDGGESPGTGPNVGWNYTNGSRGEVLGVTELPTGATTTYTWDFGSAVLKSRDDGAVLLENLIDDRGRTERAEDTLNGTATVYEYDGLDRLVSTTSVESGTGLSYLLEERTYDHSGYPFEHHTTRYDAAGFVESEAHEVLDGKGLVTQSCASAAPTGGFDFTVQDIEHDLWGREISRSWPYGASTCEWAGFGGTDLAVTYWDSLGQAREVLGDTRYGSRLYHDYLAWQVEEVDESDFQSLLVYDAHGRIIKVQQGIEDDLYTVGSYEYDALGRLTIFADGNGNEYDYYYDGAGRLRLVTGPDIGQRSYSYSGFNRTDMLDSAGQTAVWGYDTVNRPVSLTVSDPVHGPANYGWTWDTSWQGKLGSTSDPDGMVSFSYDGFGFLEETERTWTASGRSALWAYENDLRGRQATVHTPEGRTLQNVREHGRIKGIHEGGAQLIEFDYNDFGDLSGWSTASGLDTFYDYHTPGVPEFVGTTAGSSWVFERTYDWMDNNLLDGVYDGSAWAYYDYNNFKQLETVSGAWSESFFWDMAGNPTSITEHSGRTWTYDPAGPGNQIPGRVDGPIAESFSYDDAGRMESMVRGADTLVYEYDGLGRLRIIKKNGNITLSIHWDADGSIHKRGAYDPRVGALLSDYSFGDWSFEEAGSKVKEEIRAGAVVVGRNQDGSYRWYFKELGGHVAGAANDAGSPVQGRELASFGAVRSAWGDLEHQGLHGMYFETSHPLYAVGQRHVRRRDGMFLQPDPMVIAGPPSRALADPLRVSTYRYARNSPSSAWDPSGEVADFFVDMAFIALDGYLYSKDPTSINRMALEADIVCAAIPFVTGGGPIVRGGNAVVKTVTHTDAIAGGVAQVGKKGMSILEQAAPLADGGQTANGAMDFARRAGGHVAATGAMVGKKIGHTFTKHGSANTEQLLQQAKNSGMPVGQWLDNAAAEKFIAEHLGELSQGAKVFDLPEGLGRIINPDGTFTAATKAKLVPSGSGVKTAFPL